MHHHAGGERGSHIDTEGAFGNQGQKLIGIAPAAVDSPQQGDEHCETASRRDPTSRLDFNRLSCRSASGPRADPHLVFGTLHEAPGNEVHREACDHRGDKLPESCPSFENRGNRPATMIAIAKPLKYWAPAFLSSFRPAFLIARHPDAMRIRFDLQTRILGVSLGGGGTIKAIVDRLSADIPALCVLYLETLLVDLGSENGNIELNVVHATLGPPIETVYAQPPGVWIDGTAMAFG